MLRRPRSEPPVELTASTRAAGDQAMTLIAHVLMTMRWNRSRWVPSALATAALIGSAWETHTIVPPGWAARRRSSVDTMRCCISEKLSPPGKRNVDGARCTVCHSGFFISCFSSAPVHSPNSHSSSPRSTRARWPVILAIGAAVSRARSSGDVYSASTCFSSPIRSAALLGLLPTGVGEVQSGGPSGQDLAGRRRLSVPDEQDGGEGWGSVPRRHGWAPNLLSAAMDRPAAPATVGRRSRPGSSTATTTSRDATFYEPLRLVTHIDDGAIAEVGRLYTELGLTGDVLDLMSSWVSHFERPPAGLTVLGMNADELARNPDATTAVVHDLNADPHLPFDDATFDAVDVLRVGRLPRPPGRGVRRRGPGAAAGRAVRVHVLQPLLPDEGDQGLAGQRRPRVGWPSSTRTSS